MVIIWNGSISTGFGSLGAPHFDWKSEEERRSAAAAVSVTDKILFIFEHRMFGLPGRFCLSYSWKDHSLSPDTGEGTVKNIGRWTRFEVLRCYVWIYRGFYRGKYVTFGLDELFLYYCVCVCVCVYVCVSSSKFKLKLNNLVQRLQFGT